MQTFEPAEAEICPQILYANLHHSEWNKNVIKDPDIYVPYNYDRQNYFQFLSVSAKDLFHRI